MSQCLPGACGSTAFTKADLDRFTDKIEYVLDDERGRRHFKHFMISSKMKDGCRTLKFLEHTEKLLNYKDDAGSSSYRGYLEDLDNLIDEAERIEELDFAIMEALTTARISEDKDSIVEMLKRLKAEATKSLRREFLQYRNHFLPSKKN